MGIICSGNQKLVFWKFLCNLLKCFNALGNKSSIENRAGVKNIFIFDSVFLFCFLFLVSCLLFFVFYVFEPRLEPPMQSSTPVSTYTLPGTIGILFVPFEPHFWNVFYTSSVISSKTIKWMNTGYVKQSSPSGRAGSICIGTSRGDQCPLTQRLAVRSGSGPDALTQRVCFFNNFPIEIQLNTPYTYRSQSWQNDRSRTWTHVIEC